MKKMLLLLSMLSIGGMASANSTLQSTVVTPTQPTQVVAQQPFIVISAFEKNSANQLNSLNSRVVKRSEASHRLCWVILNHAKQGKIKVEEHIYSPASTQFVDPSATFVGRSQDGKYHRLDRELRVMPEHQQLEKCWQFDQTDPLGVYEIQLKVDDIEFPKQEFRLID